jgi:hypothetical protein
MNAFCGHSRISDEMVVEARHEVPRAEYAVPRDAPKWCGIRRLHEPPVLSRWSYTAGVQYEWDPEKDRINREKHGVFICRSINGLLGWSAHHCVR